MLKIGEFASLTGISIHMLRNYDKIGLLIPEFVDNINNYRYYSENQIIAANRIQILKELGFGLKEISQIITCSDDDVRKIIEIKIVEMNNSIKHIEQQIQQMHQAVNNFDFFSDLVFSAKIVTLKARKVVSLRANISKFEDEGLLWEKLDGECSANNIITSKDDYSYAITHSVDLQNNFIDTEVMKTVSEIPKEKSELRFYEIPETEAVVVAFKGIYSSISDISCYVHNYIRDMDYEIYGAPLRKYYVSPRNECDPDNYITEYYFTLKKIHKSS